MICWGFLNTKNPNISLIQVKLADVTKISCYKGNSMSDESSLIFRPWLAVNVITNFNVLCLLMTSSCDLRIVLSFIISECVKRLMERKTKKPNEKNQSKEEKENTRITIKRKVKRGKMKLKRERKKMHKNFYEDRENGRSEDTKTNEGGKT